MASAAVISRPGILGVGDGVPSLSLLSLGEKVVKMSSGTTHAAVVCASGRVYTFGSSRYHEWMAQKNVSEPTPVAVVLSSTKKIVDVTCGKDCTFFLTDRGEVYACGLNTSGQLGLGNKTNTKTPLEVKILPPVKKVAISHNHTVALTATGEVWVSGCNEHGKLGLGHTESHQTQFTRVPNLLKDITDVACGLNHTVLLSKSLGILVAGSNDRQRLGLPGKDNSTRFVPLCLHNLDFTAIACGSDHTLALSVDGRVWAWGSNEDGQLDIGEAQTESAPAVMKLKKNRVTSLCPRYGHTALVTDEGGVLLCGRGTSGYLVTSADKRNVYRLTSMQKAQSMFVLEVTFGLSYALILVTTVEDIHPSAQLEFHENTYMYEKNSILKCLECPVCFKTYSKSIYICANGHSLCESCFPKLNYTSPMCRKPLEGKNIALQHLIGEAQIPCTHCFECVSLASLSTHTVVCSERKHACPLEEACRWSGRLNDVLGHARSCHSEKTWNLPHRFSQSLSDQKFYKELLEVHGNIFLFLRRHNKAEKRLQFATKCIGRPEDAKNFKFLMTFNTTDENFKLEIKENVSSYNVTDEKLFKSKKCISLMTEMVADLKCDAPLNCKISIVKSDVK